MALPLSRSGTKVWIIDVGRSYRNLSELLDGEFIEFSDERSNMICLNPFSMVVDINNDMEMLLPLIAQMASPRGPLITTPYSALAVAIKRVWDQKERAATITDVDDPPRTRSPQRNRGKPTGSFLIGHILELI